VLAANADVELSGGIGVVEAGDDGGNPAGSGVHANLHASSRTRFRGGVRDALGGSVRLIKQGIPGGVPVIPSVVAVVPPVFASVVAVVLTIGPMVPAVVAAVVSTIVSVIPAVVAAVVSTSAAGPAELVAIVVVIVKVIPREVLAADGVLVDHQSPVGRTEDAAITHGGVVTHCCLSLVAVNAPNACTKTRENSWL
jgi:hypothetical protein